MKGAAKIPGRSRWKSTSPFTYFTLVGSVFVALFVLRSLSNIIQSQYVRTGAGIDIGSGLGQGVAFSRSGKNDPSIKPPSTTAPPQKIAYVFAGSVRSFLCPKVHWSIRLHLMDALGGEAHSFIRLSTEDNKNTRTGDGVVYTPDHDLGELNATLAILNPKKIEYFKLSTQDDEMKRNFPSLTHTIFRENDHRRYSMFYHRCMAYRLVTAFEQEEGIR